MEGCNISNDSTVNDKRRAALSVSQLVRYHTSKYKKANSKGNIRHKKDNETPLPLYIGLMVQFCNDRVVCPTGLQLSTFTCAAIDNIDHNPSSSSSTQSFHGTAISLIQRKSDAQGISSFLKIEENEWTKKCTSSLPEWYLQLPCTTTKKQPNVPVSNINAFQPPPIHNEPMSDEWLQMIQTLDLHNLTNISHTSWAAFHSNRSGSVTKSHSVLLPLLNESINSPSMVRHCFDILKRTLATINPNQTPVVTCDQPVYATAKQLQWLLPELYGEDKMVVMMGALHIEMSFLAALRDWLDGSGWADILVEANVTSEGKVGQCLKGSHVKRSRYIHEVSVASLYILLKKAYDVSTDGQISMKEWITRRVAESVHFKYWYITLQLELLLFQFLDTIRSANFEKFIVTLQMICPWMFAMDHTHYARWMPVFSKTLVELKTRIPDVYEEFSKGYFVACKSGRPYSCISHDQMHEQCNKDIKSDGGAVGILDNPSALMKWMVSGPLIANLLGQFDEEMGFSENDNNCVHHEDNVSCNTRFVNDVKELTQVFSHDNRNPYACGIGENLMNIASNLIMSDNANKSVCIADDVGRTQYGTFVQERLVRCEQSIF